LEVEMDLFNEFLTWAWLRHHNILSWYIRPLFIIPFVYFAYKRSWTGMLITVIALGTSMFWFPAPLTPDPRVAQFLAAEREFILGPLTAQKALAWVMVPLFFGLLGLAFWKRSWGWGLAVINLAALGKVAWSVAAGGSSGAGWAVLVPALVGMLICDVAVWAGVRFLHGRQDQKVAT
jgi:hypothetical protein